MKRKGLPVKQGMYDPQFEHDACGMGFVANIKGRKSHDIVRQALTVLGNLDHRGGQGCETNTGTEREFCCRSRTLFQARAKRRRHNATS